MDFLVPLLRADISYGCLYSFGIAETNFNVQIRGIFTAFLFTKLVEVEKVFTWYVQPVSNYTILYQNLIYQKHYFVSIILEIFQKV